MFDWSCLLELKMKSWPNYYWFWKPNDQKTILTFDCYLHLVKIWSDQWSKSLYQDLSIRLRTETACQLILVLSFMKLGNWKMFRCSHHIYMGLLQFRAIKQFYFRHNNTNCIETTCILAFYAKTMMRATKHWMGLYKHW